jgi:hypothetical protein
MYAHYFPLMALGRFRERITRGSSFRIQNDMGSNGSLGFASR